VGAHAATDCISCHPNAQVGNFDRTDTQCVTCHRDDLASATSPDHLAQGWVDDCQRCHIPTTWTGEGFNHASFPLIGVHRQIDCTACHVNNVFAGTPNQCVDCHLDDYQGTTAPDHAQAGFPTACQTCHTPFGWTPSSFAHTSFPLTGAHAQQACSACHAGGVYRGTPSACYACHQDDYRGTTDPPHEGTGIPTSCQNCHNTVSWRRVDFDHQGVTGNCEQCHLADYRATTNPNHQAANFPLNCLFCHTSTRTWRGASFDHFFFPIDSGAHEGFACNACHIVPQNYSVFSCTVCHERRETNNEHDRVRNYVYESNACYDCHPGGRKR
jgi:hypothetical protein